MNFKLFKIGIASILLFYTSCKEGGEVQKSADNKEQVKDLTNVLIIKVEGVFHKNDHLQLFYSNDSNFLETNSIVQVVYGQSILQSIVFELPKDKKPQNLRLDLGENTSQTGLTIKDISIEYNGEKIANEPEKFRELFGDTYFTTYDPLTMEYNIALNDQKVFDPMLMGTDKLKRTLNKLYNKQAK